MAGPVCTGKVVECQSCSICSSWVPSHTRCFCLPLSLPAHFDQRHQSLPTLACMFPSRPCPPFVLGSQIFTSSVSQAQVGAANHLKILPHSSGLLLALTQLSCTCSPSSPTPYLPPPQKPAPHSYLYNSPCAINPKLSSTS